MAHKREPKSLKNRLVNLKKEPNTLKIGYYAYQKRKHGNTQANWVKLSLAQKFRLL